MFEVQVFSSGNNVANGKPSAQSSTLRTGLEASRAVDGDATTFSHTGAQVQGSLVWWEVDLGNEYSVESVTIMNRWCTDATDPPGCLCRLSSAELLLVDGQGSVTAALAMGDTCGKSRLLLEIPCFSNE